MTNTARRIWAAAPAESGGSKNVRVVGPHGRAKPGNRHVSGNSALADSEKPIPVLPQQLPTMAQIPRISACVAEALA
jgi:hypothetical protein